MGDGTYEGVEREMYTIINNHTRGKLTPSQRTHLRDALLEYLAKYLEEGGLYASL